MDQENIDFSDIEKFLVTSYMKCPIHKRLITYLRLDDNKDSQTLKCQKCIDEKKFKSFLDIVEFLQSDENFIFQKWPIYDDDKISETLEQISQWPYFQYCDEINLIFDDLVQQINLKRKEILKDLGQIKDNKQKPLTYYKQISQKEKLVNIIKCQFGDQKNQNEMILDVIQENEQNYESNKKQLADLIYEANKHIFDLNKIKDIKNQAVSLINNFNTFDNQQDHEIVEQPNNIMPVINNDQSQTINQNNQFGYNKNQLVNIDLEEITINKLEDLDKCQNFKKIKIDFKTYNLGGYPLDELQYAFDKCKNITDLQIDLLGTSIGDQTMENITKGLVKHQKITKLQLWLADNLICNEAVQSIAIAIQKNKNMVYLELGLRKNNIDEQGALHVLSAIQNYKKIVRLVINLWESNLSQETARLIAKILQDFHNLSQLELNLEDNNIGFEGSILIMNEIEKKNESIKKLELNLKNNNIDSSNLKQLKNKFDTLRQQTNKQWIIHI
ncbi:hypothetical protein ABPG73_006705 [Tetrahymena malaccensis]